MEMLDEEEQEMAHDDVVEDVVEANDDQEPDVVAHKKQDAVEDVVEANDDQEPDVEAHRKDVVEDVVE